jgi:hypothetical protein
MNDEIPATDGSLPLTTGGAEPAPMSEEAYTAGLTPTGLPHHLGPGFVDFGRIPKPVDDIIRAIEPEPDLSDTDDGRFIGNFDSDHGVLTVRFERSGELTGEWPGNPSLTPAECDEHEIDDYGSNAVQLVERDHLVDAVTELLRGLSNSDLVKLRDGTAFDELRELVGERLAEHLFD